MRNIVLGVVAALLLVGAVAAGIIYIPPLFVRPPSPAEAAQSVKPGFVGEKEIGAWKLVCKKVPPKRHASPSVFKNGNRVSRLVGPPGHQQLMVYVRIPDRPCWATIGLQNSNLPADRMDANYVLRGPDGVLFLAVRVPPALVPNPPADPSAQPQPGGILHVKWSAGNRDAPVRFCDPAGCLAPMPVPPEEESKFLATKDLMVAFPAVPGRKPKTVNVPVYGMAETVNTMRRLEK